MLMISMQGFLSLVPNIVDEKHFEVGKIVIGNIIPLKIILNTTKIA